jgi:hypothetical protein
MISARKRLRYFGYRTCGSLCVEVLCGSQGMAVDHTGLDSGREGGWVQTVVVCGPGEGGGVWGDQREGRECCG